MHTGFTIELHTETVFNQKYKVNTGIAVKNSRPAKTIPECSPVREIENCRENSISGIKNQETLFQTV